MKKLFLIISILSISYSCKNALDTSSKDKITTAKQHEFAIIIHGGAGTILKENLSEEKEKEYKLKLEEAIRTGYAILKNGGTSQEAVMKTIQVMEESPLFNAGKGAVFTHEETNELDASFMDGETLNAGAVAGVKNVKSPIELAVKIMTDSEHVMLSGRRRFNFCERKRIGNCRPKLFLYRKTF